MTLETLTVELKKLLIKAIDNGLDPDEVCQIVESILESDDWTYTEDE